LAMDAKMQGTGTWYFAVKEGLFVKQETKSTVSGVITADAMNMSIAMTGQQTGSLALVKK